MRLIPIEAVKEGTHLAKTLFDDNGRILLREGVQLSGKFIKRIQDMGIFSIYINDGYSSVEIEDIIKPEIRQKSVKILKDTFSTIEKLNSTTNNSSYKSKNNQLKEKETYFNSITEIANNILEELTSRKNIMINLVDIKSRDNYTYQHCVNVAVLSLTLGIKLNLNNIELYNLCVGALLHDIGKVFISDTVLLKNAPLSQDEFNLVKKHSEKGYDYLKGSLDLSPMSRIIALQHHERIDGKGYPDGRKGEDINKLAKIVAIADVYDALTSDRPYRRAMSPNEAIEYILGSGQTHFDYQMVRAFAETIIPYPEGTLVELSNTNIAVVVGIMPHFPLRPKVKIVESQDDNLIGKELDLMNNLDIVIKGVTYSIDK